MGNQRLPGALAPDDEVLRGQDGGRRGVRRDGWLEGSPDDAARAGTGSRRERARLRSARPPLPPALRAQRRRLLLASAPVVFLLALLAVRLVTLNPVHEQTLAAYQAGDRATTLEWAHRQGWVNLAEPFRASFAVASGHVVGGRFDLARPWFEQALEEVPTGGLDECKVRVNLGLTYERLGDDASARERPDEARQFYEKGIRVTQERPPLCDVPEDGEDTGARLADAQQRMEEKVQGVPPESGSQPDAPPEPAPTPPVEPTPDPEQAPSERQQEQLERQQRENTAERNRELGSEDRGIPSGPMDVYPRPW